MQRHIIPNGVGRLWHVWGELRDLVGNPSGDAAKMGDLAQQLTAAPDGAESYDDTLRQWHRILPHADVVKYDEARYAEDPKYQRDYALVLDEFGVKAVRKLADVLSERAFEDRTVTSTEADTLSSVLYAVIEGKACHFQAPEDIEAMFGAIGLATFGTFRYRTMEHELVERAPNAPRVFRYDDPGWAIYFQALDRGERCEIDEAFYFDRLEVLPPIFMRRTVELADGTTHSVDFGAAEGDGVLIAAYWHEGPENARRYFSQMTKLRTRG